MPSNDVSLPQKDMEVLAWIQSLNEDRNKARDEIVDLLDHAHEDGMCEEDRRECLLGLKLLDYEEEGGLHE